MKQRIYLKVSRYFWFVTCLLLILMGYGCGALLRRVYGFQKPKERTIPEVLTEVRERGWSTEHTLFFTPSGFERYYSGRVQFPQVIIVNHAGELIFKRHAVVCAKGFPDFLDSLLDAPFPEVHPGRSVSGELATLGKDRFMFRDGQAFDLPGEAGYYVFSFWALYARPMAHWVDTVAQRVSRFGSRPVYHFAVNCDPLVEHRQMN